MAWRHLQNKKGETINIQSGLIREMDKSKYFKNVLLENEVGLSFNEERGYINVSAKFHKKLPFVEEGYSSSLEFIGDKVPAFEMSGSNQSVDILYFKNLIDFGIRFSSKESEHEIIVLKKRFAGKSSFKKEYEGLQKKIEKYNLKKIDGDKFCCPKINFNFKNGFPKVVGTSLDLAGGHYTINKFFNKQPLP